MGKAKDMSTEEWSRLERESRRRALTEAELRAIVRASSFGGAPGLEVVLLQREVRRARRALEQALSFAMTVQVCPHETPDRGGYAADKRMQAATRRACELALGRPEDA